MVGCVVVHHFPCAHCTIIHMDRPHQTTPPAPMLLSIGGRPFQSPPPPSPALIDMSPEPPTCTPTRTHRHESSTTHPCPYSFIFSTTSPTSQSSTAHARSWLRRAAAAPPPCFPLSPAFFNSPFHYPTQHPKVTPAPTNHTTPPPTTTHKILACPGTTSTCAAAAALSMFSMALMLAHHLRDLIDMRAQRDMERCDHSST